MMEQLVFAAPLPSPLTLDLGYLLLLSVLLAMGLAAVAYAVFRWIAAEPQSPALARRMRFRKRHRAVDIGGGLVSRVFVAGAAALVAGAYFTGGFDAFRDVETARAALAAWGTRAYVLYFVSFSLLEPLGVPALLFILPAGIVWGPWTAFALSLPAGVCAGIVGFVFARHLARDWVAARLPERLRRYDERLAENGLATVVLVRLVFFLFPPAHWFFGLSQVRFGAFVVGTAVGLVPGLLAATFLGGGLVEWLTRQPPSVWACAGTMIAGLIVLRRRFRSGRRLEPAT
jgi:uncharacterized membrane protein YdjX (TVP38/TMEM64 family)